MVEKELTEDGECREIVSSCSLQRVQSTNEMDRMCKSEGNGGRGCEDKD